MTTSMRVGGVAWVVLSGLVLGCGSDPVSYSAPVGINLKAKSADVANATVQDEKNITTESGNPYGAFVSDARLALGGQNPTEIALERVTLTLGGGSNGVTGLEQIFAGQVDVLFVTNDSNNTYLGAHVVDPTGVGPVELEIDFASEDWQGGDFDKLLGGSFKVVVRGAAAADFQGKGSEADLQVTFSFAAFE